MAGGHPAGGASRGLPERMVQLFNADRRLTVPDDPRLRPTSTYPDFHRARIFEG